MFIGAEKSLSSDGGDLLMIVERNRVLELPGNGINERIVKRK